MLIGKLAVELLFYFVYVCQKCVESEEACQGITVLIHLDFLVFSPSL